MIKYTYEDHESSLKIWVDPNDGSLNVTVSNNTVKVPDETGWEMIKIIKDKQSAFYEAERKKKSPWMRFMESLTGRERVYLSGMEVGNG